MTIASSTVPQRHPLRIIGDHLARRETPFEERRRAVEVADSWLKGGGDGEVGVRLLMHAVSLEMHGASRDPGVGDTLRIYQGMVPRAWIGALANIWSSILGIVEREPDIPPAPLLSALHYWVFPSSVGAGQGPDEETAAEIRHIAARVIAQLVEMFGDRPGVLWRLREYSRRGELALQIDVPDNFSVLFPEDWDGFRRT